MLYKNVSGKVKFFKVDGKHVTVNNGETIDLIKEPSSTERGLELVEESIEEIIQTPEIEVVEEVSLAELKKMTKDELNDFAAKREIDVNTSQTKKVMIEIIQEALKQ